MILLDRLVVADIGEHGVEDGQFGAVGGDRQSRLRHEREQTHRFERDGLAAGVRAGDDELATVVLEFDCHWDYGASFGFEVSLEQWMAGVVEEEIGFRRLAIGFRKF